MTTPRALHSHATPEWGTPDHIIELARTALQRIDLDPATTLFFNQKVQAATIYTQQTNGLAHPWTGHVFLNPPGLQVRPFWQKLVQHHLAGDVPRAIWVGFSVEQLCVLSDEPHSPTDFPTLILRKRLAFVSPTSSKNSPSHGNYLTFLGFDPRTAVLDPFRSLGKLVRPCVI